MLAVVVLLLNDLAIAFPSGELMRIGLARRRKQNFGHSQAFIGGEADGFTGIGESNRVNFLAGHLGLVLRVKRLQSFAHNLRLAGNNG